jgi:chemotaxis protein MotB
MSTPPIIIKKVKKVVAGHHGGSWKIAYADFLAGMMTFFLLMWLISVMSPKQRASIAAYFKKFNIFKKAGLSMLLEYYKTGTIEIYRITSETPTKLPIIKGIGEKFEKVVKTYLKSLKEHVLININEKKGIVKIEIIDLVNKPLFKGGSAELTPEAKKILKIFAEILKDLPVTISVEGHTDTVPYKGGKVGNWELSTARALSAMLELEKDGVPPQKFKEVVGYADNFPLFKNPYDPRNRRITLTLHYQPPTKKFSKISPSKITQE